MYIYLFICCPDYDVKQTYMVMDNKQLLCTGNYNVNGIINIQ